MSEQFPPIPLHEHLPASTFQAYANAQSNTPFYPNLGPGDSGLNDRQDEYLSSLRADTLNLAGYVARKLDSRGESPTTSAAGIRVETHTRRKGLKKVQDTTESRRDIVSDKGWQLGTHYSTDGHTMGELLLVKDGDGAKLINVTAEQMTSESSGRGQRSLRIVEQDKTGKTYKHGVRTMSGNIDADPGAGTKTFDRRVGLEQEVQTKLIKLLVDRGYVGHMITRTYQRNVEINQLNQQQRSLNDGLPTRALPGSTPVSQTPAGESVNGDIAKLLASERVRPTVKDDDDYEVMLNLISGFTSGDGEATPDANTEPHDRHTDRITTQTIADNLIARRSVIQAIWKNDPILSQFDFANADPTQPSFMAIREAAYDAVWSDAVSIRHELIENGVLSDDDVTDEGSKVLLDSDQVLTHKLVRRGDYDPTPDDEPSTETDPSSKESDTEISDTDVQNELQHPTVFDDDDNMEHLLNHVSGINRRSIADKRSRQLPSMSLESITSHLVGRQDVINYLLAEDDAYKGKKVDYDTLPVKEKAELRKQAAAAVSITAKELHESLRQAGIVAKDSNKVIKTTEQIMRFKLERRQQIIQEEAESNE